MVPAVDVYLFPAVVGGGLGDIEEVLAAGRHLERAGLRSVLYRRSGRALPRHVDGPWEWPRTLERRRTLRPQSPAALTVSPSWGVSAGPELPGPLGRAGPWQAEAAEVEARYGSAHTLHVSLEEFARTWTSRRETLERWREGGRSATQIRRFMHTARFRREVRAWHDAYRRFRQFDRPNVLHLYGTFSPARAFSREFPEAVQCGPLWPHRHRARARAPTRRRSASWLWYASPASAERILPAVLSGLAAADPPPFLAIRSPRAWRIAPLPGEGELSTEPESPSAWKRRFEHAELRIVTGSRSLLEAIELGGPFLYFNGVSGPLGRPRRHRPDKLEALVRAAVARGCSPALIRDLRDFARARRVAAVTRQAARRVGPWRRFPRGRWVSGFRPPYDDLGRLLVHVAEALGQASTSSAVVHGVRARAPR